MEPKHKNKANQNITVLRTEVKITRNNALVQQMNIAAVNEFGKFELNAQQQQQQQQNLQHTHTQHKRCCN